MLLEIETNKQTPLSLLEATALESPDPISFFTFFIPKSEFSTRFETSQISYQIMIANNLSFSCHKSNLST